MSWRHKSLDKFCILPSGYNGIITFVRWQRTAKSSPYSSLFGDSVGACAAADARCGFGRAFGGGRVGVLVRVCWLRWLWSWLAVASPARL